MIADDTVSLCAHDQSFLIKVALICDLRKVTDVDSGGFPLLLFDLNTEKGQSRMCPFNQSRSGKSENVSITSKTTVLLQLHQMMHKLQTSMLSLSALACWLHRDKHCCLNLKDAGMLLWLCLFTCSFHKLGLQKVYKQFLVDACINSSPYSARRSPTSNQL